MQKNLENSYSVSSFIFIKLLAIVYFIAFYSLSSQIIPLIGENGILPLKEYLQNANFKLPTLFWLNSDDYTIQYICTGGVLLSVLLFFGFFPTLILVLLWMFYLSLVVAGQEFLAFQWDNLLLETGFLSIFLPPICKRFISPAEPIKLVVVFFKILIFKLMFMSGVVKITSGDIAWRDFTALTYHYFTQPIPNPVAYYFNFLPLWFHKISCLFMFFIELITPLFVFSKRKLRIISFVFLLALQVMILISGNYCFFNCLTLFLCVFLIDDLVWLNLFPFLNKIDAKKYKFIPVKLFYPFVFVIIFTTVIQIFGLQWSPSPLPKSLLNLYYSIIPFRSFNTYGLFAVMTKSRPEIILEGSNDRLNWKAYEFKYKVGDEKRMPPFVAPHQPRLDWQMWFAALSDYKSNPWFLNLCSKILEGNESVLRLIKVNPFPDVPPRYLRALVYDYKFADINTKKNLKVWWIRELKGMYCPLMYIEE